MSATRPGHEARTNRPVPLDAAAFEKLLTAAWVIQTQRDLELSPSEYQGLQHSFSSYKDLVVHNEPSLPAAKRRVEGPAPDLSDARNHRAISVPGKLPPSRVEHMRSQSEVAGSLALARESAPRNDSSPSPFRVLHGAGGTVSRTTPVLEHLRKILPFHYGVRLRLVQSKPSFSAARFAAVILVLLVVITFLLLKFTVHHSGPTLVRASAPPAGGVPESAISAGSEISGLPRLESSHLHVTDDATLSELQDFSRFELQSIRRQAEFGDGAAALTLGMAYETGEGNYLRAAHRQPAGFSFPPRTAIRQPNTTSLYAICRVTELPPIPNSSECGSTTPRAMGLRKRSTLSITVYS